LPIPLVQVHAGVAQGLFPPATHLFIEGNYEIHSPISHEIDGLQIG
jgi:hypothetical protein